jgi:hypothetical protein
VEKRSSLTEEPSEEEEEAEEEVDEGTYAITLSQGAVKRLAGIVRSLSN